jgi:hypothetical protein
MLLYLTSVLTDIQSWERLTGKSQLLREKGAESGGSLEKKMAELPKDGPLVTCIFQSSPCTLTCRRPRWSAERLEGNSRRAVFDLKRDERCLSCFSDRGKQEAQRVFMELVRTKKSEEVVFGKGFVPVLAAFFAGTDEEIAQFSNLKKSGERIHIVIDPTGTVTLNGEALRSSK